MKDALGHGSEGRGLHSLSNADASMFGASAGHRILKSNTAAAQELAKGNPKAGAVSIHDAQGGSSYAYSGKFKANELQATDMGQGRYAVRPKGQMGSMGYSPRPWTVGYHDARSPTAAILQHLKGPIS